MRVAIALGSNLGDRHAHLAFAVAELSRLLTQIRLSSIIESDPQDVPDEQPRYLNAVVVGKTDLEPEALLEQLMAIERARGRERPSAAPSAPEGRPFAAPGVSEGKAASLKAARTLDLDIVLYGDRILSTPTLEIPHPRFRDRAFVLVPLAELEPDWLDPVTGKSIREMLTGE